MGRPGLTRHRKFARLARLLDSEALARGCLELIWDTAYENGDPDLGDAADVEYQARWKGEPGKLAAAMVEAGFLDEADGRYRVHDLWDHCPDYVRKRRVRERERCEKGARLRSEDGGDRPDNDRSKTGQRRPNGRTPSPSPPPAPTPAPSEGTLPLPSDSPRTAARFARAGEGNAKGRLDDLALKLGPVQRDRFTAERKRLEQKRRDARPTGISDHKWRPMRENRMAAQRDARWLEERWGPFLGTDDLPPPILEVAAS